LIEGKIDVMICSVYVLHEPVISVV
jgi:hypothetical protein